MPSRWERLRYTRPDVPEQTTVAVNAMMDQIELNRRIPDGKFDVSLPSGTEVVERLDGKHRRYVVK